MCKTLCQALDRSLGRVVGRIAWRVRYALFRTCVDNDGPNCIHYRQRKSDESLCQMPWTTGNRHMMKALLTGFLGAS